MKTLTPEQVKARRRVVAKEALAWAARLRGAVVADKEKARAEELAAEAYDVSRYAVEIVAHDKVRALLRAVGRAIREGTISEAWGSPEGRQKLISTGLGNYDPRLAFQATLRNAYAAGRNQRIDSDPGVVYRVYRTMQDSRVRDAHRVFNGLVLPADAAVWDTISPPNDPRCRCRVYGLDEAGLAKLKARGVKVQETMPDVPQVVHVNKQTGEKLTLPAGVAPGWHHKPGSAAADESLRRALIERERRLANTPAADW